MDEETLLHMYRNTYNEFLEAFKVKMDQNDGLKELVEESFNHVKESKIRKELEQKLSGILEI